MKLGAMPSAAVLALVAWCGGTLAAPVQTWITTADQSHLFAPAAPAAFGVDRAAGIVIDVDPAMRYQEVAGFGAAVTDASDFSRSHYSFDDMPAGQSDPELKRFPIDANRADVLPVVKSALGVNPDLKVMASPWSAPGWMKIVFGGRR